MVVITDRQMDKYFPGMEDAHYPEMHVVYRSNDDCLAFIRSPNGQVFKLQAMQSGMNLDSFLDGFIDLKVWFHSDLETMRSKLGF